MKPPIEIRNPQRARIVHRQPIISATTATESELARERRLERFALWLTEIALVAFLALAGVILGDVWP